MGIKILHGFGLISCFLFLYNQLINILTPRNLCQVINCVVAPNTVGTFLHRGVRDATAASNHQDGAVFPMGGLTMNSQYYEVLWLSLFQGGEVDSCLRGPHSCPSPPAWTETQEEKHNKYNIYTSKHCIKSAKSAFSYKGHDCIAIFSSVTSFRNSPAGVWAESVAACQSSSFPGSEIYFVYHVASGWSRYSAGTVTVIFPRQSSWYGCVKKLCD